MYVYVCVYTSVEPKTSQLAYDMLVAANITVLFDFHLFGAHRVRVCRCR